VTDNNSVIAYKGGYCMVMVPQPVNPVEFHLQWNTY